ncbi:serine protease SP24D-like [Eurosta solidaginis]|uniref:serine protease SP24D-like n=1 Tax=Eurosta solidaginis TaxID=178769 RepID=UPI0035308ED0
MSKILAALVFCCCAIALTSAKPHIDGRIVGGVDAIDGTFPYQVSLRKSGSHTCGGSIISTRYVLSAAHCVGYSNDDDEYVIYDANLYTIRAGSTNRLSGGVVSRVAEIIVHGEYGNFLHDFSLLRLETPLIFSKNIKAITLASSEVPTGETVVISGWGRLTTYGDIPTKLQWNTVKSLSKLSCLTSIGMFSDSLLCLAHPSGNGACFGDSGGPAAYQGKLVGVASFVINGCGSSSPDAYAMVSNHLDWIRKHSDVV